MSIGSNPFRRAGISWGEPLPHAPRVPSGAEEKSPMHGLDRAYADVAVEGNRVMKQLPACSLRAARNAALAAPGRDG